MEDLLETLAAQQKETGEGIEKIWINYRKDPKVRKNEQYLQDRLKNLNKLWDKFKATHSEIQSLQLDHPYLAKNYYSQIEGIYLVAVKALKTNLEEETTKQKEDNTRKTQKDEHTPIIPREATTSSNSQVQSIRDEEADADQERRLKRQKALKTALLRIIDRVEQEADSSHSKAYYMQKLKCLAEYWSSIANLNNEIIAFSKDQCIRNDEFNELEDIYHETIISLQEKYDQSQEPSGFEQELKLPPIKIPQFNGNLNQWTSFHDMFVEMIHKNKTLKNVQKMQYLKSNTSGEAERLIRHLVISNENYSTAWELMVNRYNNRRLLVATHIQALLSLQPLTSESSEGIKNLHDLTKENIHALQNLKINTKDWGPIITQIIIKKLDKETHRLYEHSLKSPREVPTLDDLYSFLETRFHALEAMNENKNKGQINASKGQSGNHNKQPYKLHHAGIASQCRVCEETHKISSCDKFREMSKQQRFDLCKREKLCMNCLMSNHTNKECKNNQRCKVCKGKHHTMIHLDSFRKPEKKNNNQPESTPTKSNSVSNQEADIQSHFAGNKQNNYKILLATAQINVMSPKGHSVTIRALIDQGSEATFITEDVVQQLRLKKTRIHANIEGIGANTAETANALVQVSFKPSHESTYKGTVNALVLKRLTKLIPSEPIINRQEWEHIQHLVLADQSFNEPGPINMILGADVYSQIILNTVIKGAPNTPIAQKTKLGWILSGPVARNKTANSKNITCMINKVNIDETLKKFWEMESIQENRTLMTLEEAECERFYEDNHYRNPDGTYTVRIPFNKNIEKLGNSRNMAVARLIQVEKRLAKNKNLETEYRKFMDEYIKANHMSLIKSKANYEDNQVCYLPHHAVLKLTSTTTKVRVVFDASSKTSTDISLNDTMLNGPVLQEDLTSILLRWRIHKIAYTADIEKMYRQIKIEDSDRKYHRIVWRNTPDQRIQEYQLNTVTYGTKTAPYLAIKTLHQLAQDEKDRFPTAAEVLVKDFYVDDLMSGNDNIKDAIEIQQQLIKLLKTAGFNLRKWASNNPDLLKHIPKESVEQVSYDIASDDTIKTLGILWNPKIDSFEFKIHLPEEAKAPTKRSLLSDSAKLFDPLGWLAPAIVTAKIMFQQLWVVGLTWDEKLPDELASKWIKYRKELITLEKIKIPRWIQYTRNCKSFELHGFCDSSESAYAAVIYSRIKTESGKVVVTLLTAKTKVAPISNKPSLPRLELCGAVLLANLMKQVQAAIKINNITVKAWTDSTIVLAWLKGSPSRWKTFVANRVSQITSIIPPSHWSHVKTEENPADCASRGTYPSQLQNHGLWWTGPKWLSEAEIEYTFKAETTTLEQKSISTFMATTQKKEIISELLTKYSSVTRLKRVIAYVQRFIHNSRAGEERRMAGAITAEELDKALLMVIRTTQFEYFPEETKQLKKGLQLDKKSNILSLTPFIDKDEIIRVGGRLQNAEIPYEQKHPIIIPYNSALTSLLIHEAHKVTLHGGNTLTLAFLRNKYWIVNGLRAVKKEIHRCVTCHRYKAETRTQLMGSLPAPRLTIERPFTNTGVDYAGPIDIRMSKGRGNKSYKGYICIFVCLVTKAIHLEAVSDLTAQAFVAAYKRFTARRGNIKNIYSDNGTNFVKANKILGQDAKHYVKQYNEEITSFLSNKGVQWHFIPASAPHFGGLWEVGVKSIKYHLKRTIGEAKLTFEELTTILTQIEACLNSRPICALTQNPDDLQILTPGHFLIGSSLLAPPEQNRLEGKQNMLNRWQLLERKNQEFWTKWKAEYLSRLQQRPKWTKLENNIKVGELVLLKEDNVPPSQWIRGRIIETYQGQDGLTRVVTVKTAKGTLKRPITKICSLPVIDNEETKADEKRTYDGPTATEKKESYCCNISTITNNQDKNSSNIRPKERQPKQLNASNSNNEPMSSINKVPEKLIYQFRKVRDSRTTAKIKIRPTTIPLRPPIEELIEHNNKRRKIQPRRAQIQMGTVLSTLLLILLVLPAFAQDAIEIVQFTNHPGIYFEDLGQADLTNNEWNIIVYYNMDIYWQELIIFRNTVNRIKDACNKIMSDRRTICLKIANQFQIKMDEIEFKNNLLNNANVITTNKSRTKRGAINVIGNIANSLFGVLDSEFAKHHEEQIHLLQANDDHLLSLIKKQISVADTTKNIIKKEKIEIEEQLNTFQHHIDSLRSDLETNDNRLIDQQQAVAISNLAIYLSLIMDNYIRTQNALIGVVTNIHNGKIDPLLLTPEQLKQQLEFIRIHAPSFLRVPADSASTESILQIYKLLKVKARVTSHNVIFDIRVPLVAREQYQLLKIISVPAQHGKEFVYIEPSTDYIIVSLDREQYYPIDINELQQCSMLSQQRIICKQHKPLYNLLSDVSKCEINLLRHEKTLSPTCQLRSMKPTQVWIQLHNPNTWIFVLDQEYTFNIICEDKVVTKILKEDGIIKLQPNCIIKQRTMTISSHNYYPSQLNSSFTPNLNVSEQIVIGNTTKRIKTNRKDINLRGVTGDLEQLEQTISQLESNLTLTTALDHHDIHHYSLSYTIIGIIIITAAYIIWKRYRPHRINLPRPAPRKLEAKDFVLQGSTIGENVQECTY